MTKAEAIKGITDFDDEFEVTVANTPELVNEAYKLRYQVYCQERSFLEGKDGTETDEFDKYSYHVLLVNRASREVVGCARLIVGSVSRPNSSFPIQRLYKGALPPGLPGGVCAEVSRFAISKARRSASSTALMRLALVRGLVRLSGQLGITYWCAVMEPSLLRLLHATSIVFHPLGPLVEYHGLRQPCWNHVGDLLDRVASDRPALWEFLTLGGTLWNPAIREMSLAA